MNMLVNQYLPSLPEPWVAAINHWILKRSKLRAPLASGELELAWNDAEFATPTVVIRFKLLEHDWAIALQTLGAIDARLQGEPFMLMPESLRSFTVQKILNDFLNKIPPAIAHNLEFATVEWSLSSELESWQKFPFTLTNLTQSTQTNGFLLIKEHSTLNWFTENLPFLKPAKSGLEKSLNIQTRLDLGITYIPLQQIKELCINDLVWIEKVKFNKNGLLVNFDITTSIASLTIQAYWQRSTLTVLQRSSGRTSIFTESRDYFLEHSPMQIDVEQLELPITFDLGELSLPLSDIERIGPDYVFELPCEAADAVVNLRIHGKLIAQGNLVTVGRRLAVRLTKIHTSEDREVTENIS